MVDVAVCCANRGEEKWVGLMCLLSPPTVMLDGAGVHHPGEAGASLAGGLVHAFPQRLQPAVEQGQL